MAARETKAEHGARLVREYESRMEGLESFHRAVGLELNYCLKQEHWEDSDGFDRRPSRIQPRGRQLLQTIYHMAGQISRSEIYVDCRPVDRRGDERKAEIVRQLIEHEIHDPRKLYHRLRRRLATFALAGRAWGMKVAFDPDLGSYGELVFSEVDIRHLAWTRGFFTPHDMHCPTLWETVPMTRDALMGMRAHGWDVEGLVPDMDSADDIVQTDDFSDPISSNGGTPRESPLYEDRYKVVLGWQRNLRTRVKVEREYQRFHPDMRFMQCGRQPELGCGFRSLPQWQERRPLPERDDRMCPACGGDLWRVDGMAVEEDRLAYPDGLLSVFAPAHNKLIFEGNWPQRTRSFPYLVYSVRDFPHEPMGSSVTSEMWTRQSQLDIMDRQAMEQMALSKPIWAFPDGDVLLDWQKRPFYMGDEQGTVAFYKAAFGRSGIEKHQAEGLPASWATLRQTLSADFERSQGTNDMSLDPERSRNIPVGTVQALERIREIPVEALVDGLRWEESIYLGCAWDIMHEEYTDERLRRLADDQGNEYIAAVRASDQPEMDVRVTASPTLARIGQEAAETAAYVAGLPPHIRKFVARSLNVPVSVLRDLERDEQAMREAQAQAPPEVPGAALPTAPAVLPGIQPQGAVT